MSTPILPPQATPAASLLKTLGLVSTVCGLIIVGAYQGTYDAAAANRRLALERTVFKVIPAAKTMTAWQATPQGIRYDTPDKDDAFTEIAAGIRLLVDSLLNSK